MQSLMAAHQRHHPLFRDRVDAGRQLAASLETLQERDAVVLGIPRGGVPVAAEIARRRHAELDLVVARKVGVPRQPELAMGAVTADGARIVNHWIVRELGITEMELEEAFVVAAVEAARQEQELRGNLSAVPLAGRTVIVVDDGLATGATLRAAIRSLRGHHPARLVAALPVGSHEACLTVGSEVDELICLHQPGPFGWVGRYYADFPATGDDEVRRLLEEARRAGHPSAAR